MTSSTTWKVGPLAQASGLTVRTLHHWDTIALLTPSERTAGGHRSYSEQDVARLYQILALRSLGLGLETIATCLDSGVDPVRLVQDHLAGVEATIAGLDQLRERLHRLSSELTCGRMPSSGDLFAALAALSAVDPQSETVLRRHLDGDQLQVLRKRAAALGPAMHYLLEVEWPELYRRAERLRVAGTPPTDPQVRKLVARMDELGVLFTGGDSDISAGVRAAWHEDPAALSGDPGAPADAWHDLGSYLEHARGRTA
ncbi:MerR family transcriptional regulator [Kitasatospora sp. NBC_01287]|uniref:MerR family transcriptional regulator n=1 Tax=Kitasatospora sp. NBC_01287 TaxID=2903573 RepID=UPI002253A050|nr:MerR family transcriptional regulator [Kitasatospora sp. NBC_01287]MCX4744233.1 MerR family transcriptional regulator [Kitasatospora sp. NBC_01287]